MNKILVFDDEESIRIFYSHELSEEGYEVITSDDCSRLLKLIEEEKPDLIIMDIRLGQYNGLDLLQDIRNTHFNLPVILCTAYPAFKGDLKSIAADYYLVKSSNLKELKYKITLAFKGGVQSLSAANQGEVYNTKPTPMEQMGLNW